MYFDLLVGRQMANGISKELLEMVDIGCRKMGDRFICLFIDKMFNISKAARHAFVEASYKKSDVTFTIFLQ